MDTLNQLRDMLNERLGTEPDKVVPEARLESLDIDSLMLLDLMFEFEEKLGVELPKDMPNPETVKDLLDIFAKLQPPADKP